MADDVLAAHYMAGVIGVALLRRWYEPGADNRVRMNELESVLQRAGEFPHNLTLNPSEQTVSDGYRDWSSSYDGPNPMIDAEEIIVRPWIRESVVSLQEAETPVRALDAGCGTGRQAATLLDLGCEVIAVDATPEMLDIARTKLPSANTKLGMLDDLPVDDDSVDFAIASLAICHLADPAPAVAELARVVRPGGTIIISEPHPMVSALGGQAFYGGFDAGMQFVRNHHHPIASWLNAFAAVDVRVDECVEVPYDASVLRTNPLRPLMEDALHAGFDGLPFILCFRLTLDGARPTHP